MPDIQTSVLNRSSAGRIVIYALILILGAFLVSMIFMLTKEDPQKTYKKNSNIRVEVLNGCGVNRLAIKVTNMLRSKGFNVVKIGNTNQQDFEETVVIERSEENMKNAKYLAGQIGCKNITKEVDPALYLEVTIIVGKDYEMIFNDVENIFQ